MRKIDEIVEGRQRVLFWVGKKLGWLLAIVVAGLAIWLLLNFLMGAERGVDESAFSVRNDSIKTIAQVLGGVILLGMLYVNNRRVKAAEDTVKATEEGQITERFTKAVEQLGSDNMAIRLGGIFALERIAKDSKKDHWTVMEVLTGFVREQVPYDAAKADEQRGKLREDIQAILTVIGRRKLEHEEGSEHRLDLSYTDLAGSNLKRGHFERTVFTGGIWKWHSYLKRIWKGLFWMRLI